MKFENLYNNVMKSRFLIEDFEDMDGEEEISIPSEIEIGEPKEDESIKHGRISDAILSYIKSLKDSKTTYSDLLSYVSRLGSVESEKDAEYYITAALKHCKEDGLRISTQEGKAISGTDIVSVDEYGEEDDDEAAYSEEPDKSHEDFDNDDTDDEEDMRMNMPRSYGVDVE